VLSGAHTATPRFEAPARPGPGSLTFRLDVTDDDGKVGSGLQIS
jgi:hypothetical protein